VAQFSNHPTFRFLYYTGPLDFFTAFIGPLDVLTLRPWGETFESKSMSLHRLLRARMNKTGYCLTVSVIVSSGTMFLSMECMRGLHKAGMPNMIVGANHLVWAV
jgi:hypothetical protein